jgi:SAM-dependent MidA family methyltransferase
MLIFTLSPVILKGIPMSELSALIRAEIAPAGSIPFERFMDLALYHPKFGYYRRPRQKPRTGRQGDFFTSVSVGPLFGRLLARQFFEMWQKLEMPAPFWIIEQGAEDAQLACDILSWCRTEAPEFFTALRYAIIEPVPANQLLQREKIEPIGLIDPVIWFPNLDNLPSFNPTGVFFSNELVDSFPVAVVIRRQEIWLERHVTLGPSGQFAWTEKPITNPQLAAAVLDLPPLEGYTTEIKFRARAWMRLVVGILSRGYVLTIDYGFPASSYYASFRSAGTLTAYRDHRRSDDMLRDPGAGDITAHVDFTALAHAGESAGLITLGFLDQQHLLMGIAHDELGGAPAAQTGIAARLRAWQTLTHPEHLGARFHALLQAKDAPSNLAGLRHARPDKLHS